MPIHTIVDRLDPCEDRQGLLLSTEAQLEHRTEGPVEARDMPVAPSAEPAVVCDSAGYERVGQLEHYRGTPRKEQDDLPLKFASDGVDARPRFWRVRS